MASIEAVGAREILDSRGNPTVEVEVALDDGTIGRAAVPSGASTGAFEAVELRDGGEALRRQGRQQGGRRRPRRDRPGAGRLRGLRAAARRPAAARPRRHPEQGPARRERHPRRLAGRGPCRRRLGRPAAVPLRRRAQRPPAAGADDEHPQRRRARRHRRRRPGVHDRADRRAPPSARRCAQGAEVYHALKSVLKEKGLATGLGDEGGFAPDLPSNREALDLIADAVEQGRPAGSATTSCFALDVAATEFFTDGAYPFEGVRQVGRRDAGLLRRPRRVVPDRLDRGPARRGGLGRLERHDRRARRQGPARRRRPVRHQRRAARPRHRRAVRQRAAGEGQPDRLAHRDPRLRRPGAPQRLPLHDEPPLRARPRTPPSPTSPWPPTAARSRPARRRAPSGSRSTTSCCASRRSSTTPPATPVAARSRATAEQLT